MGIQNADGMDVGQWDSHKIWGTGSLETGCGTYNYSLNWNRTSFAVSTSNTLSSTVSTSPSTTGKPNVGSTALGISGTEIVRVSGYAVVGMAFAVGWFL